jgi:DNA-binding GntR family transcriptional regulator
MAMTTEQVASILEQRIVAGTYSPGDLAPSTRNITAEFGVAAGTARRALAMLESRGLMVGGGQGRQRRVADGRGAAYATALERIRADIANGTLRPGAELPSEAELVAATGFSRYAVREALSELERTGEAVNRPGRRRQVAGGLGTSTARYEHVMAAVQEDVRQGRLVSGVRLPSEAELCERFDVSRVTVRHALAKLEEAGVFTRDAAGRRIVA